MFSGHVPEGVRGGIAPRQQIIDLAIGMAVDDFGDDLGEVIAWFDVAELAGLDQRGDHGPMFAAAIGAGEQSVLPVQRNRSDGAFDDVAIDFDTTVIEEAGQAVPAR